MRKNNCEVIRRELDELMLGETCSTAAAEHLEECAACREFQNTQTKLRHMVGSLGTVAAPPDFDFRLRARLANDPGAGVFHFWSFAPRASAVAALLVVVAFGVVVVRNVLNQRGRHEVTVAVQPPVQRESPVAVQNAESKTPEPSKGLTALKPPSNALQNRSERAGQTGSRIKRPLTAVDFASQGAEVISGSGQVGSGATAVIPIDVSMQSLRFSFDDGRGNAKTISVPAIRFGSQRMLPNVNQLAAKGIW